MIFHISHIQSAQVSNDEFFQEFNGTGIVSRQQKWHRLAPKRQARHPPGQGAEQLSIRTVEQYKDLIKKSGNKFGGKR
jgi:hypothetical protein